MRKVTFPRMGTSYIAFDYLIKELGHEAITPPELTQKTLSYGTKYSPEFACLPFKILTGTYLEALEKGADTIVSSGGVGPCRAGYYGKMHEKILNDLGHYPDMLIFEPIKKYPFDFIKKIKLLKGKTPWFKLLPIVRRAWRKLIALDDIEIFSKQIRPYEINRGETTKKFNQGITYIDEAASLTSIEEAKQTAIESLESVPQYSYPEKPIKIGLIGEIYVMLEPFVNLEIEKQLGDLGVEVERSIYLTNWTRDNTIQDGEKDTREIAKPYLDQLVGGHGQNNIGETVLYKQHGFDGVIHLAPFTCIPEIVAKSILPKLSQKLNMPVMTLFLDEQTGKAGIETRLEAFVDLIKKKRRSEVG